MFFKWSFVEGIDLYIHGFDFLDLLQFVAISIHQTFNLLGTLFEVLPA